MAAQQHEGIALSHSPLHRYWEPVYEDSMDLIAKLPGIAAAIYRWGAKGQRESTCLSMSRARAMPSLHLLRQPPATTTIVRCAS